MEKLLKKNFFVSEQSEELRETNAKAQEDQKQGEIQLEEQHKITLISGRGIGVWKGCAYAADCSHSEWTSVAPIQDIRMEV